MPGYDSTLALKPEQFFAGEAGGAATTEYAKFRTAWKIKLRRAALTVTTAGTVTGHGYDLMHGTTTVASVVVGTGTAGVSTSIDVTDRDIAAGEVLSIKTKADQAGKVHVTWVYENYHDAEVPT